VTEAEAVDWVMAGLSSFSIGYVFGVLVAHFKKLFDIL
jgi:hypothetical protein